jgi:hypothetical protein
MGVNAIATCEILSAFKVNQFRKYQSSDVPIVVMLRLDM